MAQKVVLGKGLASLFPSVGATQVKGDGGHAESREGRVSAHVDGEVAVADEATTGSRERHLGISMAGLEEIHVSQFQPRREFDESALRELAQSIVTNGIIQPLVVRKNSKGSYELIAGERRLRAAKMAGLKQVPVVIRKSTDRETLQVALIENIQRQNLNCVDEALAYFRLMQDFSLTQDQISEQVGKDRATISNYLRLLRLPEMIIDDLRNQILTFGHGKALLGLEDTEQKLRARTLILEKKLSVRETEALVESMKQGAQAEKFEPKSAKRDSISQRISQLAHELTRFWSARVEIKGNEKKGKISIHYSSREELERILETMRHSKV